MNRLLSWAIVLVLGLFGLQWLVPGWVGGAASAWVAKHFHGPRATVEVSAIPFWQLASGHFQVLIVRAHDLTMNGVIVRAFELDWQNGHIGFGGPGRPVRILNVGVLRGQVRIAGTEIARLVDQRGILSNSRVTLRGREMSIAGMIRLGKRVMGFALEGPLTVTQDGSTIIFHPQELDHAKLAFKTAMTVLNVSQLHLPVALRLTSVHIGAGTLTLGFRNR